MRAGVGQALGAGTTATNTGANYGAQAAGINSTLTPFLTRQLNNPMGFTPQQQTSQLSSAMAGSGGTNAGIATEAGLNAARTRNSGGENAILDQASRNMGKQNASASEGIASNNANLQQRQQQQAAEGLSSIGQTDTSAQLKAMGLVPEDINAATGADQTGWFQRMQGIIADLENKPTGK